VEREQSKEANEQRAKQITYSSVWLPLELKDRGSKFVHYICKLVSLYTASYPRRQNHHSHHHEHLRSHKASHNATILSCQWTVICKIFNNAVSPTKEN
jgi:hypothetical protein